MNREPAAAPFTLSQGLLALAGAVAAGWIGGWLLILVCLALGIDARQLAPVWLWGVLAMVVTCSASLAFCHRIASRYPASPAR
jgi:hypothetical protein